MPAKMKSRPVKLLFLNAGHKKLSVNKFYSVPPLKGTLKARKKYGVFGAKIATAGPHVPHSVHLCDGLAWDERERLLAHLLPFK